MCGKCNAERVRKYRSTVNGRAGLHKIVKKYESLNAEKRKAWSKANYLKRQLPCEICQNLPTQKHHPDYSKPVEVVYLCAYHHKQVHLNQHE
jgi:hypothetical protein